MKIFISIKKKWLQHRVYKYTLKYQNALSKSESLSKLSDDYYSAAKYSDETFGTNASRSIDLHKTSNHYSLESSYQKNLSDMYLNKKLDLEEELHFSTYQKA